MPNSTVFCSNTSSEISYYKNMSIPSLIGSIQALLVCVTAVGHSVIQRRLVLRKNEICFSRLMRMATKVEWIYVMVLRYSLQTSPTATPWQNCIHYSTTWNIHPHFLWCKFPTAL